MGNLGQIVEKVRSKNAGPFWLTVDIFCGDRASFEYICAHLSTDTVAAVYGQPVDQIKRYDIADLNVVKFSFPRPVPQGTRLDRDMHGAQWAILLEELPFPAPTDLA